MRDDFSNKIKKLLAQRVGYRCSNPDCRKSTSGPTENPEKAINVGVAAHITAASIGGPRYEEHLTSNQRSNIDNGIWLCQNCAKLIDSDNMRYNVNLLKSWKNKAENYALKLIETSQSEGLGWRDSLKRQLTTFSRVQFQLPPINIIKSEKTKDDLKKDVSDLIFKALTVSYLKTSLFENRDNFIFGLTLEDNSTNEYVDISAELITHITSFGYHFGELSGYINSNKYDQLESELKKAYPVGLSKKYAFGRFLPYRVTRENPAKVSIELVKKGIYFFDKKLSTSDLIYVFSGGVNGNPVLFDGLEDVEEAQKISKLIGEIQDGFDLSEVWINPDNPEDWKVN